MLFRSLHIRTDIAEVMIGERKNYGLSGSSFAKGLPNIAFFQQPEARANIEAPTNPAAACARGLVVVRSRVIRRPVPGSPAPIAQSSAIDIELDSVGFVWDHGLV